MKQQDLIKKLEAAEYRWIRDDGLHMIYGKPGCESVLIPKHREINESLARSIMKKAGLR